MPQLSFDPLSTSAAVNVPFPEASKITVTSCAITFGASLSSTVMVAVHVDSFPLLSVTVSITVFVPICVQSNAVWLNAKEATPQASVEPLSTVAASKVAFPEASNCTVTSWHSAQAVYYQPHVTLAVAVENYPFASVTVKVTVGPLPAATE